MSYEWDDNKNAVNIKKHGLSFETAARVFDDPMHIEFIDDTHSIGELRYIAIGKVGEILFVVFAERGENTRIISARLATDKERKLYYDSNV